MSEERMSEERMSEEPIDRKADGQEIGSDGEQKDKAIKGKKGRRGKRKVSKVFIAVILLFVIWTIWSWVPVTEKIKIDYAKVNGDGVRIVLVTDLHSCYYGKNQNWLVKRIEKENPDLIMLGGDIFDDKIGDKNAKLLLEQLVKKYPCYYVTGNHEYWSERVDEMKSYLREIGVHVLEGDCETITINGTTIDICGVDDPTYMYIGSWEEQLKAVYEKTDETHLRILLSHRPEKTEIYEKYHFDLILTGHAHAGQIRVPFINKGVFAPDQGFMAEYVNGMYALSNDSIMEVSRGLARESTLAPRFFNHPEIVVIDLQ